MTDKLLIERELLERLAGNGPTSTLSATLELRAILAAPSAPATAQGVNQQLLEALAALIADYDGEIHNEYDGTSMLDGLLAKINYAREAIAQSQEVK